MVRTLALLGLALLVVVSAGCGGGRGVTTTITNTPPPSGNVRLLQPGDDLRYDISGTHFDGWHSWPVTGSYSETVLSETVTVPASSITSEAGPYTALTDVVGTGTVTLRFLDGSSVSVTLTAGNDSLAGLRNALNSSVPGVTATITNTGSASSPDYRLTLDVDAPSSVGSRITEVDTSALAGGTAPTFRLVTARVVSQEIVLDTLKTEVLWDNDKSAWIAQREGDSFKSLEAKVNVTERYYITQDADGTIWTYGGVSGDGMYDDVRQVGVAYWVSEPSSGRYKLLGSPLTVGNGWSANVVQSNGTVYSPTFVVSTAEVSNVPAGSFMAHRIAGNGRLAGMIGEIELWLAPDVGAPSQFGVTATGYIANDFASTGYSARTLTLTFKLAAKSRQRV